LQAAAGTRPGDRLRFFPGLGGSGSGALGLAASAATLLLGLGGQGGKSPAAVGPQGSRVGRSPGPRGLGCGVRLSASAAGSGCAGLQLRWPRAWASGSKRGHWGCGLQKKNKRTTNEETTTRGEYNMSSLLLL
jgi:hypothetical protein